CSNVRAEEGLAPVTSMTFRLYDDILMCWPSSFCTTGVDCNPCNDDHQATSLNIDIKFEIN
ncbi:unnamed protein product, partial [Allacma fusca]